MELIEGATSVLEFARVPGIFELCTFITSSINDREIPNMQAATYIYQDLVSLIAI